jgi:hypothetical protein
VQVEREHPAHDGGLPVVHGEPFLLALPARQIEGLRSVPEGRPGPVEVALPGVLAHGPERVLQVLLALVLIEEADDPPQHLAGDVLSHRLRDGDELHAGPSQPPLIDRELNHVPEEAGLRVDHNGVEW